MEVSQTIKTAGFGPEQAAKLKALRKAAGLSQRQLAERMARGGKSYRKLISRLETGRMSRPGMTLLADYLKACGAPAEELTALLGLPETPTKAGKPGRKLKPRTHEQKLAAVKRQASRNVQRTLLEEMLYQMLKEAAEPQSYEEVLALTEYGRRLYALILRDRRDRSAARGKLLAVPGMTPDHAGLVEHVVDGVVQVLAESGDLDREPRVDAEAVVAKRLKINRPKPAEARLLDDERQETGKWNIARFKKTEAVRLEVVKMLLDQGLEKDRAARYALLVTELWAEAEHYGPGSPERAERARAILARTAARRHVPAEESRTDLASRVIDLVYRRHDELAPAIPPRPRGLPRRRPQARPHTD